MTSELVCRGCSGPLAGVADSSLPWCESCRVALVPGDDELAVPVRFGTARGYEGGLCVPMFRFASPGSWLGPDVETGSETRQRIDALDAVWTVAVRIRAFQVHGEVGYEYTRRPPRLEAGSARPTMSATRSLTDARLVARTLLWRYVNEVVEAGPVSLTEDHGSAELWFVPTQNDDGLVKFPHCPIRYPAAQIEGYQAAQAALKAL